jgi:anti-sigma-K factor RskA
MHFNPDPFVMTTVARQRHEAFQAESDRDRLARLAQRTGPGNRGQTWPDLLAAAAVALALLAAGAVAAQGPTSQPLSALLPMESISTNLLVVEDPETSAVQKVREAAQVKTDAAEPTADADLAKATPKLFLGTIRLTDILVS